MSSFQVSNLKLSRFQVYNFKPPSFQHQVSILKFSSSQPQVFKFQVSNFKFSTFTFSLNVLKFPTLSFQVFKLFEPSTFRIWNLDLLGPKLFDFGILTLGPKTLGRLGDCQKCSPCDRQSGYLNGPVWIPEQKRMISKTCHLKQIDTYDFREETSTRSSGVTCWALGPISRNQFRVPADVWARLASHPLSRR